MKIPEILLGQVRRGQVVLFFGAGATKGALTSDGHEPPLGDELRNRIAERFLGGTYTSETLAWVSELAISNTDLFTVQDYVADQFRDLQPANFHRLTPTFTWRGLATTNYDRVIEAAYESTAKPIQTIVSFVSNKDRVDEKLRDRSSVALLKLHGCITRTHDETLPLILTPDQYLTYLDGRTRLFQMLEEWGSENTIVFVGHRLLDPNLRAILIRLTQKISSRPRYYLIRPGIESIEQDFWDGKRISVLDGTFEEFLAALDAAIPIALRPLGPVLPKEHPIQLRFAVKDPPSPSLLEYLANDVEYVHEGLPIEQGDPGRFYAGFDLGWYSIAARLDVARQITDRLLFDIILPPEEDRPSLVELYLIKAEAGAGKSVLLRRLAWEAATQARVLCIRSRGIMPRSYEGVRQMSRATGERIFLFVDNAADNVFAIREIIEYARSKKFALTVIAAERINEWNVSCRDLEDYLSDQYQLRYLSHAEIGSLVRLLTEHKSLGPYLEKKTFEECVREFEERAGRQLLVALHEATHGKPFEEILLDEYRNIVPHEAQHIYLTVCVLNRFEVPVRAGIVSRVHGIAFEEFKDRFLRPLEHVVQVQMLPWSDYAYTARHSEIAEIVFEQVLTEQTERFNEYIRIIKALNPMFSVDLEALRLMLRAKSVHELFPRFEDAKEIYSAAHQAIGDDAYLLQQNANYERIRPDGNLQQAQSLLEKARVLDPRDSTIVHTLAEVLRAKAEIAQMPLERARFRNEAFALLRSIASKSPTASYSFVTRLKLATDQVRDILYEATSTDREIDEAIRQFERTVEEAKQRFPGNEHVLSAEAEFAKVLQDHERSFTALKRARDANPRDPFIVSRLVSLLLTRGDLDTAIAYTKEALESNRGDKRLNYQYADLLRVNGRESISELAYYYRRAFTKWDNNYESQFWYARYAFESSKDEEEESKEVFRYLRNVALSHRERTRTRDVIGGFENPTRFSGTILRLEASHGFVIVDGRGNVIFFHENDVLDGAWKELASEMRVSFSIGFSLRGPKGLRVTLEGEKI